HWSSLFWSNSVQFRAFFRSYGLDPSTLSNIHTCSSTLKKDRTQDMCRQYTGCLDNIWGRCKAHFPGHSSSNQLWIWQQVPCPLRNMSHG
ncbi:hypothetical protein L208DRAFT_1335256, partial [Tricholoma matsutake]